MLSNAELTAMRADVEAMLPDTCDILTLTLTVDGQGGFTEAWNTTTADVACRLDPMSAREQMAGDAVQPFKTFKLTLPYGTALTETNRVKIGTTTYAVTGIDSGKSWAVSVRATVEKV